MGTRFSSHQLNNGLNVSGRPEQPTKKPRIDYVVSCRSLHRWGRRELGKIFGILIVRFGSSMGWRPGQHDPTRQSGKVMYGPSVTSLTEEGKFGFEVLKVAMWVFSVMVLMGLVVGYS
ncbi:hypothetical protein DCAR_0102207 [Daucus carota subsp. sativus]|uniref:Uncharacterized protein n=1 Tax=Daucus carota subsp. sativus TaxID=79200 RepID=A0A166GYG9_DAUCS|nr:hypothetical protein DCAR_0102207 [Daucus carota subsp. sativus]